MHAPPKSARNARDNNLQTSCNVPKQPQKNAAQKPRSWRASLIRKRAKAQLFLGFVDEPDRASAVVAAVKAFNLDDEQRSRLVVQERE
jgi:hypothetical protein